MCQITDEPNAYQNWLKEIYGEGNVPKREGWITYNDIRRSSRNGPSPSSTPAS